LEGRRVGDTHITGSHNGGDTHITSDMCTGIHISRGYTYHCDTGMQFMGKLVNRKAIVLLQSHAKSISVHVKYNKPLTKKFSKHNIVMRDPFVTHTR